MEEKAEAKEGSETITTNNNNKQTKITAASAVPGN
jgi:hypothetical protein